MNQLYNVKESYIFFMQGFFFFFCLTIVYLALPNIFSFQLNSVQRSEGLRRISFTNTVIGDTCPKPSPCPTTKYHTSDGTCNNLAHPDWGKAFGTYSRVLPPRYSDGKRCFAIINGLSYFWDIRCNFFFFIFNSACS